MRIICVTNDHIFFPLVVSTSQSVIYSWLITGFVTRVTRHVLHVEQELFCPAEHMSSRPDQWCLCCFIFSFMCMFCRSLIVSVLLVIVLSVLRFPDSDWAFCIFKLFLNQLCFIVYYLQYGRPIKYVAFNVRSSVILLLPLYRIQNFSHDFMGYQFQHLQKVGV